MAYITLSEKSSRTYSEEQIMWHSWSQDTFRIAHDENKPVFLHIYERNCRFSQSMAKNCFADKMVIKLLNRDYIPVKIDKDEYKEISDFCSSICIKIHGKTALPMNVFFTPFKKPFYVISYMERFPKNNSLSFVDLLHEITFLWKYNHDDILEISDELSESTNSSPFSAARPTLFLCREAFDSFFRCYDSDFGGFGLAPKFPMPHQILFLLKYYTSFNDKTALDMAEKTLLNMYRGSLFDHISGGFFRYANDHAWEQPCFEKRLADNALLLYTYCCAYKITQNNDYQKAIIKTTDFMLRCLRSKNGSFYTGISTELNMAYGRYYFLSKTEIDFILGKEKSDEFCKYFCLTSAFAAEEGKSMPRINKVMEAPFDIESSVKKIDGYRSSRSNLCVDKTAVIAYNGLSMMALAKAFAVTGISDALNAAERIHVFIEKNMWKCGTLMHSTNDVSLSQLSDYAFYALGLLELYKATADDRYLSDAEYIAALIPHVFRTDGGEYYSISDIKLPANRTSVITDSDVPSGSSAAALTFLKLGNITKKPMWQSLARHQLSFIAYTVSLHYTAHAFSLYALLEDLKPNSD